MSLLSVAELRAQVATQLTDPQLQAVIDREEALIVTQYGGHYVDASTAFTEKYRGGGENLFLRRAVTSVSSISERVGLADAPLILSTDAYFVWANEGYLTRLPEGTRWGQHVTVAYVPQDDSALRKAVLIDILRLALSRTGLKSESIAGEYSYTATDNWEAERAQIMRRLGFIRA